MDRGWLTALLKFRGPAGKVRKGVMAQDRWGGSQVSIGSWQAAGGSRPLSGRPGTQGLEAHLQVRGSK